MSQYLQSTDDRRKADRRQPARTPDGQLIVEVAFTEHDAELLAEHLHWDTTQAAKRLYALIDASIQLTRHHADEAAIAYAHKHRECGPDCCITGDECPDPDTAHKRRGGE